MSIVGSMFFLANCQGSKNDPNPQNANNAGRVLNVSESANVIFSNWTTVPAWSGLTNSAGYVYYRYIINNITQLDANMINQGLVLAYVRFDPNGSVNQMPFKRAWDRTPGKLIYENWSYQANVGQITVIIDPEDNRYVAPVGAQVRYIMSAGVVPGGRKAAIDYSNYEEVKAAFNLPD